MKKIFVFCLLILSLVLVACQTPRGEPYLPDQSEEIIEETIETPPEEPEEEIQEPEVDLSCTHNENCTWGELCIEGTCQVLAELYPSTEECTTTCKFTKVEILTSDGETYNLPPGQGSYTAAGALDWEIVSAPVYCQGEKPTIPIKILKRNYGEIFSDDVILLEIGETSKVIKHPFVKRVAFTLTIEGIEEVCS